MSQQAHQISYLNQDL